MDVKAPLRHRLHHALVQHQVAAVAGRHQHALLAIQTQQFAAAEIALDFFVDAAHRQQFAVLVDGTRHGNALTQRQTRQARQQCEQFGARCRIALDPAVLLLEHHRRVHRQGRDVRKQGGQVAVQNQHALVVDGARHLDLALDVEQALVARERARCHPHGHAKGVVAQVHHRQTVDLRDQLAADHQQALAVGNRLLNALLRTGQALLSSGLGGLHIGRLHTRSAPAVCHSMAFDHQGFGLAKQGALARLVARQAVAVFHNARHRRRRKMQQPQPLAGVGHKHRAGLHRLRRGFEAFGKVHLAAKAPGKLGLDLLHRVIGLHRGDQHQLHVHIHRLGRERHSGHGLVRHARLLDLQTPAAQKAAQLFPHRRVGQQVAQVQHQKTTVRTQQAARTDLVKVGHQVVAIGLVLDAAKQVAVQRVVFHDHRGPGAGVVVHRHVHAKQRQPGLQRLLAHRHFLAWLKQSQVVQHAQLRLLAVSNQLAGRLGGQVHLLAHTRQALVQQGLEGLPAQSRQALGHYPLQRPGLIQVAADFAAQSLFGRVHLGAFFAAQQQRLACRDRLALRVFEGEDHVPLVTHQGKVLRLGIRAQRGVGGVHLGLARLLDALALGQKIVLLQALGQLGLQVFDPLRHLLAQDPALPRRHAQSQRVIGLVKVVQVTQIGGYWPTRCQLAHHLAQQRSAAAAHLAQHKQVVVTLPHLQAKTGRRLGPPLPDPGQRRAHQGRGVHKAQRHGVHLQAQICCRQLNTAHGFTHAWQNPSLGPAGWVVCMQAHPSTHGRRGPVAFKMPYSTGPQVPVDPDRADP